MWCNILTIIFTNADFHIEYHTLAAVALAAAAGQYTSAVTTLDKGGRYIGSSVVNVTLTASNDALENMGMWFLRNQSNSDLTYGQAITGIMIRYYKAASVGTASVSSGVLVFIRN